MQILKTFTKRKIYIIVKIREFWKVVALEIFSKVVLLFLDRP